MGMYVGNSMWQLVQQSDAMSKLVLLSLLIMSVLCWTIFFYKVVLLRIKRRQVKKAIKQVRSVRTVEQLVAIANELHKTLPGYVLTENLAFLKLLLERSDHEPALLTEHQMDLVEEHIEQTVDDVMHNEQAYISFLSTSAGVAPLLGLFGTVWGLVHSFMRIAEKQSADIATVAPGIAEALITTLAGLMVAIPAYLLFHYLSSQVRSFEQRLVVLADELSRRIHQLFVA